MDLLELYSRNTKEVFLENEIEFIKTKVPIENFKIKYGFYNKVSKKSKQIVFIIDTMPNATRKSGVENYWDVCAQRNICELEYEELIQNYGCNNRRFIVWYYKTIEALIQDDLLYNLKTPPAFILKAKSKGFCEKGLH